MFAKICTQCGHDCSGQELHIPCPGCGGGQFQISFNQPMSIGAGTTVEFPPYSTNRSQVTIKTTGTADVRFGGERNSYTFRSFKKIKRTNGQNWVQVNMRRDGRGLDVIFGSNAKGPKHSHYPYTARASTLYVRNEESAQLSRYLRFDVNSGAVAPLLDLIDDPVTKTRAVLQFALEAHDVVLVSVDVSPIPSRP
jgi:hypothetical protein